jgi:signal transduction histidine kinase
VRRLLQGAAAGFAILAVLGVSTERCFADPLPLLTEIRAIRGLSLDEGARGYPVRIRGIVTHFDETLANGLIVYDGSFGQFVEPPPPSRIAIWKDLRAGDVVEIEGRTIRGGFAPNVLPERMRTLGRGRLPPAGRVPYAELLTGRHDCEYVDIVGVIQRAWLSSSPNQHTMFAEVAVEDGVLRAAFWSHSPEDLERFVDARVHLRGNVGAIFAPTEQLRGVSLFAGRTSDIEILEPAPDPFALPVRPIRSVYNYSSAADINRRIHLHGVVTARVVGGPVEAQDFSTASVFRYVRHVLYVADATGGARIETTRAPDVRAGDIVDIAGFPAVSPGKPILRDAVFRVVGTTNEPAAAPIGSENLLNADHDAALVRVDAQVLGALTTSNERVLVLKTRTGDSAFEAGLDRASGDVFAQFTPGSVVRVTGVYSYLPGPPPSFRLFLRSAGDVALVSAAPWWTLRHTIVMTVAVALTAAIGWFWVQTFAVRKRRAYQAVLTERNRVARELHDTLEQALTGISLQLEAVSGTLQTSPGTARQSLDVAQQMLRYSLEETRRSVMDLRSQALESRDLPGALADLARQMTLGTPMIAKVIVTGTPRRLDAAQEHHLLRIGLEALTNAVKHGEPAQIDLELQFQPEAMTLVVADDGKGLGPAAEGEISGSHFGMLGIRERVTKLGGTLEIQSAPGDGTRLTVVVPARAHEREQTLVRPPAEVLHG